MPFAASRAPLPLPAAALPFGASLLATGLVGAALTGPAGVLPALAMAVASAACWLPAMIRQRRIADKTLAAAHTSLEGASRMDAATGLMSRPAFAEKAAVVFANARTTGGLAAAIVVEVEHLKMINDEHGSECGDAVLAHVGKLIGLNIQQKVDLAARTAGAEFVLLLPEADEGWAATFVERLRGTLANRPIQYNSEYITVSASIGTATLTAADSDIDALIRRARKAVEPASEAARPVPVQAPSPFPLAA